MKSSAYDVLDSESSTQKEKNDALLELIKAYFSRSLSAWGYSLDHPDFDEYAAMLLNQNRFKKYDENAYNTLVMRYGKKPGIPDGETTYKIQELIDSFYNLKEKKETKKAPSVSDEADRIADIYRKLDEHGKGAVRAILDYENAAAIAEKRQDAAPKRPTLMVRKRSDGFVDLKVYDQPAAAGFGNYLDDPAFHIEQYPANVIPEGTEFGIRISGDSMAPDIRDGSTAFVQNRGAIEPGKVGIFILNDEAFCKKLVVDREKGQVRLMSLNPAYPDRIIEEYDDFRTVGLVLGQWQP